MRKGGFTGGYIIYPGFLTKEQQAQIKAKLPDIRQGDVDDLGKMATRTRLRLPLMPTASCARPAAGRGTS
ncbi:hypothetical protein [Stenotrophomonas muris]|uniref:hypothetical protein n=1 Tax=Stenotrophomonas muris TaxID=2963283 RepID=UPI0039C63AAA